MPGMHVCLKPGYRPADLHITTVEEAINIPHYILSGRIDVNTAEAHLMSTK